MFKKIILLTLILSNYLTFAEHLVVTPAMIVAGRIEINSPTVTEITFADGDYSALATFSVHDNPVLINLTIPAGLTALKKFYANGNAMLTTLTIPAGLTALKVISTNRNATLTTLTIPAGLTALKTILAKQNATLTTLTIPTGLTALEDIYADNNPMLTTLTISAGLTALEEVFAPSNVMLTTLTIHSGLTALEEINVFHCSLLTTLMMDNAMVNRSHQLAFVAPRTPETLAAVARTSSSVRFETEDITVAGVHGGAGHGAHAPIEIVGQEALTALRAEILAKWIAFRTTNTALVTELMPKESDAPKSFDEIYPKFYKKLEHLIRAKSEKDIKGIFRLKVAMQGIQLLHGDPSIPTYHGTVTENYRTTYAEGMPNNLQIFVLLYRLAQRNIQTNPSVFVKNWLAETYTGNFSEFKKQFSNYVTHSTLGEVLESPKGLELIDTLSKIITFTKGTRFNGDHMPSKVIRKMENRFHFDQYLETLNPIIEALFMTLRGHNNKLFDAAEVHKPACAFGSYLQMLRALSDPSFALHGAEAFGGVEIITCAP